MGVESKLVGIPNFDKLEIVKTGTFVLNDSSTGSSPGAGNFGTASEVLDTITHGLGYTPACFAFLEFESGSRTNLPFNTQGSSNPAQMVWFTYRASASRTSFFISKAVIIYGDTIAGSFSNARVRYYLMKESAA